MENDDTGARARGKLSFGAPTLRLPLAMGRPERRIADVRVVIDTNVLVSAMRSRRGASFRLLQRLGSDQFQPVVSPPLCLEYEDVLRRPELVPGYSPEDIEDVLDYLLSVSVECQIHFLWRPLLSDPKDDMVLEAAVAGGASFIITFNLKDFKGSAALGIQAVTPDAFLAKLVLS